MTASPGGRTRATIRSHPLPIPSILSNNRYRPLTFLIQSARALWHAGTPNFRILALTGFLWTIPLSLTEPYRYLFCHRLGLSESIVGLLVSADLVLRALGLLTSGWFLRRFGAKRLLIVADILSWVAPYLLFATAQGPTQAGIAMVMLSLNAFASTPYLCLLAEGAPERTRTKAFAFLNLCNILPGALLPWIAAGLTGTHSLLPTLRMFFLLQACTMGVGIFLRGRILRDLQPVPQSDLRRPDLRQTFGLLVRSVGYRTLWPILLLQAAVQAVWNAWSAVFLTTTLGLGDRSPGWVSQVSAFAFALAAFTLLPRVPERFIPRATASALLLSLTASSALLFPLPLVGVLAVASIQGFCSGIHMSALSSLLPANLPAHSRDHGFALTFVGIHLGVAVLMPAAGWVLDASPQRFPMVYLALAGFQALVGLALVGTRANAPQTPPAPHDSQENRVGQSLIETP